jgi:hypothetical protein
MTAPTVTGSITQIQNSSISASQSVAIPADAVLCLVGVAFFRDLTGGGRISTLTLDSNSFTSVITSNNMAYGTTCMWRYSVPVNLRGTSKTLAWTFDGALAEGANIFVIFLKDADTALNPIRASATAGGDPSATTAAFATSTNDLCVCVGYSYTTTDCNAAPSGAGQTEIADSTQFNLCQGAIGRKPGVSGTTTMKVSGDYVSLCAVSIMGTIDPLNVSPGNADLRVDVIAPTFVYGSIDISPGNADLRVDVLEPGVVLGNIDIYPGNADLRVDVLEPTVDIISAEPPPLGQADSAGFVFWMLANSYYQNIHAIAETELEEPGALNAATWGGIFFQP